MKQYVIDELKPDDHERLQSHLKACCGPAELEGVYWLILDKSQYTETQAAHRDCQPFYAAIRLRQQSIAIEFLIRTRNRIRCDCMAYATAGQIVWLVRSLDDMLGQLGITV